LIDVLTSHDVQTPSRSEVPPRMLFLTGARIALDAKTAVRADLLIEGSRIREVTVAGPNRRHENVVDLSEYLLLPGLINAHDHLEFNLFPRLGQGPYTGFQGWASDICHPERPPVREHLRVPKPVRLWWGGLKNLLCGVTTVCHHNPYEPSVFTEDFPVRVLRRYAWAHSTRMETGLQAVLRSVPSDAPFLIHLGEGTDEASRQEIFELDRLGGLDARTVIIHGVGLDEEGRALLEARRGGLVWCPSSNLFTLGRTLDRSTLLRHRRVALGSDSALSAGGDLLDEIRFARERVGFAPEEVFQMVTHGAAEVLRLTDGEGSLAPGAVADVIAVPDFGDSPAATLAKISFRDIECVIVGGRARLLSPRLTRRWTPNAAEEFHRLRIEGIERLVDAPVTPLLKQAKEHLSSGLRLAGKRVET
jgi:cytosine/adenosine deaminase-related metal-dependent hydrolase